jgi:hypothetical protein
LSDQANKEARLKAMFLEQYGQVEKQGQVLEEYDWSCGKVEIQLNYGGWRREDGHIGYYFMLISKENEKDNRQRILN